MTTLRYLGRPVDGPIKAHEIDTVPAHRRLSTVTITTDELAAVCPITSQPDLYHAEITYTPRDLVIESKALKLYLVSWRNVGVMCEDLAGQLAEDLTRVVKTPVAVTLRQQVRGGLVITAHAQGGNPHAP